MMRRASKVVVTAVFLVSVFCVPAGLRGMLRLMMTGRSCVQDSQTKVSVTAMRLVFGGTVEEITARLKALLGEERCGCLPNGFAERCHTACEVAAKRDGYFSDAKWFTQLIACAQLTSAELQKFCRLLEGKVPPAVDDDGEVITLAQAGEAVRGCLFPFDDAGDMPSPLISPDDDPSGWERAGSGGSPSTPPIAIAGARGRSPAW